MRRGRVIRVSEQEIARDARRSHASLERAFAAWQDEPPADDAERLRQLDRWIVVLGESAWRMRHAEARAAAARRKP